MKMNRKCIMSDGTIKWFSVTKKGSILHKSDGPAVEYANGSKEWWYLNVKIDCDTQEKFEQFLKLKAFW